EVLPRVRQSHAGGRARMPHERPRAAPVSGWTPGGAAVGDGQADEQGERSLMTEPGTEPDPATSIDALLLEQRRYPPSPEFAAQANAQPDIYERDPLEFWETEGRTRISWFEPFHTLLEWDL